jgi:hypothetical protein
VAILRVPRWLEDAADNGAGEVAEGPSLLYHAGIGVQVKQEPSSVSRRQRHVG